MVREIERLRVRSSPIDSSGEREVRGLDGRGAIVEADCQNQ